MTNRFTPSAERVLRCAMTEAETMGHTYVGTEHLLLGLLSVSDGVAARILSERGVHYEEIRERIRETAGFGPPSELAPSALSPRLKRVLEASARESTADRVGTEELLLALTEEPDCLAVRLLSEQHLTPAALCGEVTRYGGEKKAAPLPQILLKYGRCLTDEAGAGRLDPVIGRDRETDRVIRILCRRVKNNPCLIGEPGVGKTAVVEGLAERIAAGEVPDALRGKRIVTLDLPSMIAGAKYRGEFEERMKSVLQEVRQDPTLILFLDEIHTVVGAGSAEGSIDAANILKPALARGEIRLIGATTVSEYRRHIEKDAALERRFQPVEVEEATEAETERILLGLKDRYESHHGIRISNEAIKAAVRLSVRYLPERRLPDKAIDLIDEAAAGRRIEADRRRECLTARRGALTGLVRQKEEALAEGRTEDAEALSLIERDLRRKTDSAALPDRRDDPEPPVLRPDDVADVLSAQTGLPIPTDRSAFLPDLEKRLSEAVPGQKEATAAVASVIRQGALGLHEANRPLAGFWFCGPSGVGKTELARATAREVFGTERALLRVDCPEYADKASLSRLIGSPPGYVGFEEEGLLTGGLRRRPRTVLLFEEVEGADPALTALIERLLDEGFLTDGAGRRVDGRGAVVILTSGRESLSAVGFTADRGAERGGVLRRDLAERLDAVVPFSPLTPASAEIIAARQLKRLEERLSSRGCRVSLSPMLAASAVREALSPLFGVRPVLRLIRERYETEILRFWNENPPEEGETIVCEEENGIFSIKTVTTAENLHIL